MEKTERATKNGQSIETLAKLGKHGIRRRQTRQNTAQNTKQFSNMNPNKKPEVNLGVHEC